jgi:hypothetical protein
MAPITAAAKEHEQFVVGKFNAAADSVGGRRDDVHRSIQCHSTLLL